MIALLLLTGIILYTLKGNDVMATKKAVKKETTKSTAVPDKIPGQVVTKYGTFQLGADGEIVQTGFVKDVAQHTGTMTAEQVVADIRSQA